MDFHSRVHPIIARTHGLRCFGALSLAISLAGCGGSSAPPSQAESSDIRFGTVLAGPTPFIGVVPATGQSLKHVSMYRFQIAPKAGAVSRPVDVRYSAAAMARRGFYINGSNSASLPLFALYAGHANQVTVALTFADGSRQEKAITVSTPDYVDPNGIFDRPVIVQRRTAPSSLLNYSLLKSVTGGPIVVDADAQVRWTAPSRISGRIATVKDNAIFVGSQTTLDFLRIEWDGAIQKMVIPPQSPSNPQAQFGSFHHNLDRGKTGILAEFDGVAAGVLSIESMMAELSPAGTVLKDWDMATIIGQHMRDNGDDPSQFVRPGFDWFHMNATTYDPRDNSIIASSRENFVIKFDYATSAIRWILGDPSKYWYTFPSLRAKSLTLDAGGLYPIGQHAVSIASDGALLLFNNGAPSFNTPPLAAIGESRSYSAISAYQIDTVKMTARETWNFDYGQTILSDICSSVYESANGGYLLSYAAASKRTRARLVGLDANRAVSFDFEYASPKPCETGYNAEPVYLDSLTIE